MESDREFVLVLGLGLEVLQRFQKWITFLEDGKVNFLEEL